MSVSTEAGSAGIDINTVIEGGPSFMERLTKLAAAKKEHDAALKDLDLGRSAVQANDEAYRRLAEANEIYDKKVTEADKEINKVRDEVNAWAEKTKADYTARLYAAQQTLDEAKTMHESAQAANSSAQLILKQAQSRVDTLVNDATAKAEDILATANKKADKMLADAAKAKSNADDLVAEMAALKARYEDAARALKGALG